MLLMESIQKAKNFLFHKTVDNLKSFFQMLSKKPAIPNPFSCTSCSNKKQQKDQFYANFFEDWEIGLEEAKMKKIDPMTLKEQMREEEDECRGSFINIEDKSPKKIKRQQNGGKEENNKVGLGSSQLSKGKEQYYYKRNGGSHALAKKMKELEMMDVGDMEHVLDVEEALHYYSRLKSPVYLSIVDKFFMDMYSEFSVPQASASISSSKRRFGSIRM